LVAFPTETVYGLGADATNPWAVRGIFSAKGRPATNPLIVHVHDPEVARRYTVAWTDSAERLARKFWPGPLTLVLPKSPVIVAEATAGKQTVGLRVPNHPLALELLRAFDGPVAAPSANRSNRVSPTTARHVREELGDRVDLILDGGRCTVGIESTVLDLSHPKPIILRPGAVTREMIEGEIGAVELFEGAVQAGTAAASPGQSQVHYSPVTPAYRFEGSIPQDLRFARILLGNTRELLVSPDVVQMPDNPAEYARHLYDVLRKMDALGKQAILIEMPPDLPEWLAVRDRIRRATRPL
jgi:L-threonylcarbamoyladenylate synthase